MRKPEELNELVGDWVLGDPSAPVGRCSFSWLDGGFFLIQRWTIDIPGAPDGIAIIGEDPDSGELVQHYYDSRGVARVYGTSLRDRIWRLWRDHPGFSQRFAGELSDDGDTLNGTWELSRDGSTWEKDFDLVYTRVG
jgi:hypothetical protein